MFIINIAFTNSSVVTMKGFSTAIDQGSIIATVRGMSMIVYGLHSRQVKFVRT